MSETPAIHEEPWDIHSLIERDSRTAVLSHDQRLWLCYLRNEAIRLREGADEYERRAEQYLRDALHMRDVRMGTHPEPATGAVEMALPQTSEPARQQLRKARRVGLSRAV